MAFEAVYPEQLQMTLRAKRNLLKTPGAVVVWMFVDGVLAGEAYGIPMEGFVEQMQGAELVQDDPAQAFYCFSNTILPEFQGRGLGEARGSWVISRTGTARARPIGSTGWCWGHESLRVMPHLLCR